MQCFCNSCTFVSKCCFVYEVSCVHVHPQHMYVSIGKQVADSISTYLCVGFKRTIFSFIVVESCSRVSIPSVKFLLFLHKRTSFVFAYVFDDRQGFVCL